jgi:hypothetical protein
MFHLAPCEVYNVSLIIIIRMFHRLNGWRGVLLKEWLKCRREECPGGRERVVVVGGERRVLTADTLLILKDGSSGNGSFNEGINERTVDP